MENMKLHKFCYYYDGICFQVYSNNRFVICRTNFNFLDGVDLKGNEDLTEVFKNFVVADVCYNRPNQFIYQTDLLLNYFKKTK